MRIFTKAIVSNSEMATNYKGCREKAEKSGKTFIFKNNQPDAVLFSIAEYERFSEVIEFLEGLEDQDIAEFVGSVKKMSSRESADNTGNEMT